MDYRVSRWMAGNSEFCSRKRSISTSDCAPIDPGESFDVIKVRVVAEQRQAVLAHERGDPQIVIWNGCACDFQVPTDCCVVASGSPSTAGIPASHSKASELCLQFAVMAQAGYPKTVFVEYDAGHRKRFRFPDGIARCRYALKERRDRVGIQDHCQSSGSMCSNSSSITRSIRRNSSDSLARHPANSIHGFAETGPLRRSLARSPQPRDSVGAALDAVKATAATAARPTHRLQEWCSRRDDGCVHGAIQVRFVIEQWRSEAAEHRLAIRAACGRPDRSFGSAGRDDRQPHRLQVYAPPRRDGARDKQAARFGRERWTAAFDYARPAALRPAQ
jgi:hypothetical protein